MYVDVEACQKTDQFYILNKKNCREESRWKKGGDAPPSEERSGPWKPAQREGGVGWREREKMRSDSWKRDPDAPPSR